MTTLKFKTSINCDGCIKSVTPHLDHVPGIINWKVDTTNTDKILTVNTDSTTPDTIKQAVSKAGFKIEEISL
jgi:copper chaperone